MFGRFHSFYLAAVFAAAACSSYSQVVTVKTGAGIGGTLSGPIIFEENGTFAITNTLILAPGANVTIRPGARLLFNSGADLIVNGGAQLSAYGTPDSRVLFSRAGSTGSWGRVIVMGEAAISYAHFEFNAPNSDNPAIQVDSGTVTLDRLTFAETTSPYLHLDGASFSVSDCVFPNATDTFELVHGAGGIKTGGRGIIRRCYFGKPIGYNDAIDFTGGNRPGPIIQLINNVFMGGDDDLVDLDGTDAWIEGNIFLHAHKNGGNPETASGVSGGSNGGATSEITIIGNIFFDCDQAVTAKQGNFYTLLNNTIVHINKTGGTDTEAAVIQAGESGSTPAAGMYLEGNIIFDAPRLTRTYDPALSLVTFTNNILPVAWNGPGGGNLVADPAFDYVPNVSETQFSSWAEAQVIWSWLNLEAESPAMGKGAPASGVFLFGAPSGLSADTTARITVGINRTGNGILRPGWPEGSGITAYKWRLDSIVWSDEVAIETPIVLSGLALGPHRLEVMGKNDAGFFQEDWVLGADPTGFQSAEWIVVELLKISSVELNGGEIQMWFLAQASATYTVEMKTNLNDAGWTEVGEVTPQSSGHFLFKAAFSGPTSGFYRVVRNTK